MAVDPKKRQKKLERRTAKRKEKKHVLVREQNTGLAERLSAAARFPILNCWIPECLDEHGIGWVVLSREFPNGQVAVATFLVDRFCLGVKNVVAEVLGRFSYDSKYVRKMLSETPARDAAPADARRLLEQAVGFARSIGFAPHADYAKTVLLFGDVDSATSSAEFEFGKDGKPLFISGPNDTPARCREIVNILSNTCGLGKFDYVIAVRPNETAPTLPDARSGSAAQLFGPDDA